MSCELTVPELRGEEESKRPETVQTASPGVGAPDSHTWVLFEHPVPGLVSFSCFSLVHGP